jgi:arsenate reductase (thioredoxin)
MRILILCTHNSARSQMAEGWAKHQAQAIGLEAEIWSAGTEATRVKADAITVMNEVGIDLSTHSSKTLYDLPDPWSFDFVITVCDGADEACPVYPATTTRLHYPFHDPSGQGLEVWRRVRDQIRVQLEAFVRALKDGLPVPATYASAPSISA